MLKLIIRPIYVNLSQHISGDSDHNFKMTPRLFAQIFEIEYHMTHSLRFGSL